MEPQGIAVFIIICILILGFPICLFKLIAYFKKIGWLDKFCNLYYYCTIACLVAWRLFGNLMLTIVFMISIILMIVVGKQYIEEGEHERLKKYELKDTESSNSVGSSIDSE